MSKEIDDAFNWIILILTTISGFLIDLPETAEAKKIVASGFILPLLALYVIWFMSYFIRSVDIKLALKTLGWFYATFISMLFVFFFMDVSYGMGPLLSGLSRQFIIIIPVLLVVFFAAPILFFRLFVLPIYRVDYGDSNFLASSLKQVLLYIFAVLTFLGLALPLLVTAVKPL
jgi:hypothetical protein